MKLIKITLYLSFLLLSKAIYSNDVILKDIIKLDEPWGISFIDENQLIITEKKGDIKLFNILEKQIYSLKHNLKISSVGQGGLLDIIYKNEFVYVSYSEKINNKSSTSIGVAKYNNQFLDFTNIFRAQPSIKSGFHFGSRIVIKDNYLYASIGERGKGIIAQDPKQHPGSIIRIHLDGTIPLDNPKYDGNKEWAKELKGLGEEGSYFFSLNRYVFQIEKE